MVPSGQNDLIALDADLDQPERDQRPELLHEIARPPDGAVPFEIESQEIGQFPDGRVPEDLRSVALAGGDAPAGRCCRSPG